MQPPSHTPLPPSYAPLQEQLDTITAKTRALLRPEHLARTEQNVADLQASGLLDSLVAVGSAAPAFALTAGGGKRVRSEDLLALGPLIVKFFRGRWCPYDMTELETWQGLLPRLRQPDAGSPALLVAISPQTPRQNAFTAERHHLTFPLLSDPQSAAGTDFGLAYTVAEAARSWYRSMLVNIPFLNGDDSWRLPLPATFVLDAAGTVIFADAYADHRRRPDPQAVLEVLRKRTAAYPN